jgi:hypothetical protein
VRGQIDIATVFAVVRARRVLALALALVTFGALTAAPANADITHKYLGQITLASGTQPQPVGVDPAGNIIVWLDDQEVIAKYDPSGNPVNFSALGTNKIDGQGGLECPDVPTDCDRVPPGRLGPYLSLEGSLDRRSIAVVDQSGGPADGYIYVRNMDTTTSTGEIAVFAPTGEFLGVVNEAQVAPNGQSGDAVNHISMAPNGTFYVSRGYSEETVGAASADIMHAEAFAPIDGDPTHDLFIGQIRTEVFTNIDAIRSTMRYIIGTGPNGAFATNYGTFLTTDPIGPWKWYSLAEFQKPGTDFSLAKDYLPFGPEYNNHTEQCTTCAYHYGMVNPETKDIFLFSRHHPGIVIFDEDAHTKVGPTIALNEPEMDSFPNPARDIAFDNSGGPNQGRFYIKGGANKLSVFSAPVTIPDITVNAAEVGHYGATLNADLGKDGGPDITGCLIEYGITKGYGSTKPCTPAPTYTTDTPIEAELSGLFTEADYHYRVKATNENGTNLTPDKVFHTVAVLDVKTGATTGVNGTKATFTGSLDPDGMATTYHFEYGIATDYDLETEEFGAGSGTGSVPVNPVEVDELQPGKTYHYRLVAENTLGTTFGPDKTFTVPARPLISSLHPKNVLATSATLNARINNFDSPTEYFFEYGVTGAYGQSTPVEELVPAPQSQPVTANIANLEPGLTYHFRLVATNGHGTSKSSNATFDFAPPSCPNSHVRQQTGSNYLPDCRAYELVSPGRVGSVQLFPGDLLARLDASEGNPVFTAPETKPLYQNGGYATNPSRFGYFGSLGGVTGMDSPNFLLDHYVATRTSTGWKTNFVGLRGDQTAVSWKGQCSHTFHRCLDYRIRNTPEEQFGREPFPYLWSVDEEFLGRLPTNYAVVPGADHLTGDEVPSGDFTHFVFSSLDVPFAPGGASTAPGSVYDNAIGPKTVVIASRLNNGTPIPQDAGGPAEYIRVEGVSPDGSHILMSTVAAGGKKNLFMRVGGAVTFEVSAGSPVEFIGMSDDGSTVAFMSDSVLTTEDEDSSRDIYIWEEEEDKVRLISKGNGKGNSDSCNASWTQACNVAPITPERPDIDDLMAAGGGDIYFYSPEQFDPVNPGVFNQRNLYHLRNGKVQYVATFDPGTQADRMQISADGKYAAFLTRAELTGYDQTYFDNFGVERTALEMYVFDSSTGEIQCASCNPSGAGPTVLRSDPPANEGNEQSADVMASKNGPFMSDDGRAAFATADGLVPRDTNNLIDVYEFTEGRPQLISSGTGDRDIFPKLAILFVGQNTGLEAMSRDGSDIYFSTYESLVPQDENGAFIKFYVAKTNGGFPVLGELFPCEAADECHGATSQPAGNPEVGTGTPYSVSGNVEQTKAKKKKKKKKKTSKKSKQKRSKKKNRHARGSR